MDSIKMNFLVVILYYTVRQEVKGTEWKPYIISIIFLTTKYESAIIQKLKVKHLKIFWKWTKWKNKRWKISSYSTTTKKPVIVKVLWQQNIYKKL